MKLARKPHTAGAKTRYEVDYSNWLAEGDTLVAASCTAVVTSSSEDPTDAVVEDVLVMSQHLYFSVSGGVLSEVFTVTVTIVDTRDELETDTVEFFVIAP
jgi:hypothetical protein